MSKVTISDIEDDLYENNLDTEYREALAHSLMQLKYVSDSPLNLSMGTLEKQIELIKVYNKPLEAKEIEEIIKFMMNEMKDDFQYSKFQNVVSKYLNIANVLKKNEKRDNANRHRMLDDGIYVVDLGYRESQPVALLQKKLDNQSKEYIIAVNYKIKDNKIKWKREFHYGDDIETAQEDFVKVLNGFDLMEATDIQKDANNTSDFYSEEEIKKIINSNEELYFADDGFDEVIVRFEDIPDFIADTQRDFKFYKVNDVIYEKPDITTYGMFLDRISPDLRERLIDRLVQLQKGEIEPKEYKLIDEDMYEIVQNELEQEKNRKKNKNREAR